MGVQRWMVFSVALLVRCVVAFVFFGSVDLQNTFLDVEYLLSGVAPSALGLPYLPGIQILVWTGGLIAHASEIPIAFAFKFFGCLFDSVIAAALYDYRGWRGGLLYALAPVPVLIFGIHGQWDSICFAFLIAGLLLLRRPGARAALGAGALFVLAMIAKPIVVPFVLFFFPAPRRVLDDREERVRAMAVALGMLACFVAWMVVMRVIGDPFSITMVTRILDYARAGVTYFGLPFGLGLGGQNRLMMILPLLLLVPLHWSGRIDREEAILLSYVFLVGTCGLAAQYLLWLVPFLLICGYSRFAALYSLLSGLFLITFYVSPLGGPTGNNLENLGAFAPLRVASWLTPTIAFPEERLLLLRAIGNYAIPLAALGFLAVRLFRVRGECAPKPGHSSLAPLALAVGTTAVLVVLAWTLPRPTAEEFVARTAVKVLAYNATDELSREPPMRRHWRVPSGTQEHPFAATRLALLWVVAWSVAAMLPVSRQSAAS